MICPRCKRKTDSLICSCGFDLTRDYLDFSTLSKVRAGDQQKLQQPTQVTGPKKPEITAVTVPGDAVIPESPKVPRSPEAGSVTSKPEKKVVPSAPQTQSGPSLQGTTSVTPQPEKIDENTPASGNAEDKEITFIGKIHTLSVKKLFILGLIAMAYWAYYPYQSREFMAADSAPIRYFIPILSLIAGQIYVYSTGIRPAKGLMTKLCTGLACLFAVLTASGYISAPVMLFSKEVAGSFFCLMLGMLFNYFSLLFLYRTKDV